MMRNVTCHYIYSKQKDFIPLMCFLELTQSRILIISTNYHINQFNLKNNETIMTKKRDGKRRVYIIHN